MALLMNFSLLLYSAWFEELRKQRVAELKKELERSEDSIGLVLYIKLLCKIESSILFSTREGPFILLHTYKESETQLMGWTRTTAPQLGQFLFQA